MERFFCEVGWMDGRGRENQPRFLWLSLSHTLLVPMPSKDLKGEGLHAPVCVCVCLTVNPFLTFSPPQFQFQPVGG